MGLPRPPCFPEFIKLTMNRRDAKTQKQRGWISSWKPKGSPGLPAGGAYEVRVHTSQRRPHPIADADVAGQGHTSLMICMAISSSCSNPVGSI